MATTVTSVLILFALLIPVPAVAQFYPTQYRPPDQNWQQISTSHFRVVFPEGYLESARRTGQILEDQYTRVQRLAGGSLKKFPVIINTRNDLSNGFVAPFHFRSEIELPPMKGKALNPRSGTWLETVLPHELVHALQFSHLGNGITRAFSYLSPDFARSFHSAIPLGVLEGLAVHYETEQAVPGGGRGNYPWFTHQFNAVFDSPGRWTMGQMLHFSNWSRPLNRRYIGGYQFSRWLQHRYGPEATRNALDFYVDYPFLGYGTALRKTTGKWPGELYREFAEDTEEERNLEQVISPHSPFQMLPVTYKGAEIRRPKWLDDSTLVFYGSFYNARSGFYTYNVKNHECHQLKATNLVQDYIYDISRANRRIAYAWYRSDPYYDNTYQTQVALLDPNQNTSVSLPASRIYAPAYIEDGLLVLQADGITSRLIQIEPETGAVTQIADSKQFHFVQVAPSPADPSRLAVIARRQGLQALWLTSLNSVQEDLNRPPDVSFTQGSVFDVSWHPGGRRVLFTSGFSGTMNLYELDISGQRLLQVSNTRYNAFEGSYSPDGSHIAFIVQHKNEMLPALLKEQDFLNEPIPQAVWQAADISLDYIRPIIGENIDTSSWNPSPWRPGISWLKPRTVVPVVEKIYGRDRYQCGLSFHSNDLLQQQSYSTQITWMNNHLWYEAAYLNKQFFPGFRLAAFSRPSYRTLNFQTPQTTFWQTLLREERSFSLSIPWSRTFSRNVFNTSLHLRPQIRQSQIRYFDPERFLAVSDFANVSIVNLGTTLRYRLQRNIRDVQPNSGLLFYSEIEYYLFPGTASIQIPAGTFNRPFSKAYAAYGGIQFFLSPFRTWNQSLKLELSILTQNRDVFNNQFLISGGFAEPVFPDVHHIWSLNTRYTIPFWYPDNGGFLIPVYIGNMYMVLFSNTAGHFDENRPGARTRTVVGAGLRIRARISNLSLDLGIGIGFEPSAKSINIFAGDF